MNRLRVVSVAICTILSMLDGYDVLVMAFAAFGVAAEWQLSASQLGVLLSSALLGMAAGSLFVAPLADRIGRRAIILACLTVITVGLFLSGVARNMTELALLRGLTGIGIGGMLASINVLTAELSTDRWRSTAVSLQATGYPIGATLGGAVAAVLIAEYGWRSAFTFGGACSAVMIVIVMFFLSESPDFLASKNSPAARAKLERLRRALSLPAERPASPTPAELGRMLLTQLFAGGLRAQTLWIWGAFFFTMLAAYFVLSWTPRLLVSAGLSEQGGITSGVLMNLGGIVGGVVFAWLSRRMDSRKLTLLFLSFFCVLTPVMGWVSSDLSLAYIVASMLGAFLFGAMVGLYVVAPAIYPAGVRMTGMGYALGAGRAGAIAAPALAGLLIDSGWSTASLYLAFAVPVVGAAAAVLAIRGRLASRSARSADGAT